MLILEDRVRSWAPRTLGELVPEHFVEVMRAGPEAVELAILGVGAGMAPPPRAVREAFRTAGIGFDLMDTVAACKLYNLLAAEGRRVAACLIAV